MLDLMTINYDICNFTRVVVSSTYLKFRLIYDTLSQVFIGVIFCKYSQCICNFNISLIYTRNYFA
jgi:hypothetical protein